jgi:hypothetical protein
VKVRPREPTRFQRLYRLAAIPNIYNKPANLLSLELQFPQMEEMEFGHSFVTADVGRSIWTASISVSPRSQNRPCVILSCERLRVPQRRAEEFNCMFLMIKGLEDHACVIRHLRMHRG